MRPNRRPLLALVLLATPGSVLADEPGAAELPTPRLLANTAVLSAGLGLGSVAAYNLTQAREAYADYLEEPDADRAERLLADQVRPRQIAAIAEGAASLVTLGAGVALWATTDGIGGDRAGTTGLGRKLGGTAALGAGAASATLAVFNYAQAREAYADYLDEPNAAAAQALMDEQVRPRQLASAVETGVALLGLGVGTALWVGGEQVAVSAGPRHVGFEARF